MKRAELSYQESKTLLYSSALAKSELAFESWSRLVSVIPIEEFPAESRHWFPLVYLNLSRLKTNQGFPHRERLRVSYRSTYLANSRRLTHARPLLEGLRSSGLHYALIKGMGVSLRSGHLGLRGMGDCDLLVDRRDIHEVFGILEGHHYVPWSRQAKRRNLSGRGSGWKSVGPWVDQEGFIVDIHVPELVEVGPYSVAIRDATATGRTSRVSVPDATSLALISILHGIESSGTNDRSNAIIDFAGLRSQVDYQRLVGTLSEWRLSEVGELLSAEVLDVNKWLEMRVSMRRLSAYLQRQTEDRARVLAASEILRFRRPHLYELWGLAKSPQLRRWRYLMWTLLGRVARIESKIDRVGGFLKKTAATDSTWWCDPFEIRWKVRAKPGCRVRVHLVRKGAKSLPRVVLLSGRPIGIIPWESSNTVEIRLHDVVQEVTVRSVDGDRCFQTSDQELFRLEVCDD